MSQSVLIIGGTRNLGHYIAHWFRGSGARVAVLNRGVTPDELPPDIERLRADRTDAVALARTLGSRSFDVVVDTALYNGADAGAAVEILNGRTGRYIFISTGQVYLVRAGLQRPFRETDYDGPLIAAPALDSEDRGQWEYGAYKRDAEDVFARAWISDRFPFTSLRLPMVNSPRDHHERIANYVARIADGGPLLIPDVPRLPLRHVWVHDVVEVIAALADSDAGIGRAFNISQNESLTLDEFLQRLAAAVDRPLRTVRVPRAVLEREGLLPACSPFSGRWMSELDNERSVRELGARYAPVDAAIAEIVASERNRGTPPAGYGQRPRELELVARR